MKQINNILIIDTSDNKNVFAKLKTGNGEFIAKSDSKNSRPDSIVNLIEKVLKKAKIKISDVDDININQGPGSYTGLKVGVSVANALSFALEKKINNNELGKIIDVKYE